jgi:cob(I)alamin adenosyltransferase
VDEAHFGYNDDMTFYTSKGDDGTTGLLGEGRVAKYTRVSPWERWMNPPRRWGWRAQCADPHSGTILLHAPRDLYRLMAEVAATPESAEQFRFIIRRASPGRANQRAK